MISKICLPTITIKVKYYLKIPTLSNLSISMINFQLKKSCFLSLTLKNLSSQLVALPLTPTPKTTKGILPLSILTSTSKIEHASLFLGKTYREWINAYVRSEQVIIAGILRRWMKQRELMKTKILKIKECYYQMRFHWMAIVLYRRKQLWLRRVTEQCSKC